MPQGDQQGTQRTVTVDIRISDKAVIETRHHAEMMKRPWLWSYNGLVLPLVRRTAGHIQEGMIAVMPNEPPFRVRCGNLFMVAYGLNAARALPYIDYATAEEAVADGWQVD